MRARSLPPLPLPPRLLLVLVPALAACPGPEAEPDPCLEAGDDALASCLEPTMDAAYYVEWSERYFTTMGPDYDPDLPMPYSELVARWEWPPWLKLTAYGASHIEATDQALRATYPSVVPERECRFFETQPFGRCRVVFHYDDPDHEGRGCPIYEEFVFNDAGEITWIEAWSDDAAFGWGEDDEVGRLGTRIPGLGGPDGRIDLDSDAMLAAAEADPDVEDFRKRALDLGTWWLEELDAAGDDLWERGCGW